MRTGRLGLYRVYGIGTLVDMLGFVLKHSFVPRMPRLGRV